MKGYKIVGGKYSKMRRHNRKTTKRNTNKRKTNKRKTNKRKTNKRKTKRKTNKRKTNNIRNNKMNKHKYIKKYVGGVITAEVIAAAISIRGNEYKDKNTKKMIDSVAAGELDNLRYFIELIDTKVKSSTTSSDDLDDRGNTRVQPPLAWTREDRGNTMSHNILEVDDIQSLAKYIKDDVIDEEDLWRFELIKPADRIYSAAPAGQSNASKL